MDEGKTAGLTMVIGIIVLASIAPGIYHYLKSKTHKLDKQILTKK